MIKWIILLGWTGEALHHYRIGIFAPEHMAVSFGAIAFIGILLLFLKK
jgi:hypothetical protein